jgi:hypothetical protein
MTGTNKLTIKILFEKKRFNYTIHFFLILKLKLKILFVSIRLYDILVNICCESTTGNREFVFDWFQKGSFATFYLHAFFVNFFHNYFFV